MGLKWFQTISFGFLYKHLTSLFEMQTAEMRCAVLMTVRVDQRKLYSLFARHASLLCNSHG